MSVASWCCKNFVSFRVLVFVRAILSWCPYTWHIYIVYNILCLNISSIYIVSPGPGLSHSVEPSHQENTVLIQELVEPGEAPPKVLDTDNEFVYLLRHYDVMRSSNGQQIQSKAWQNYGFYKLHVFTMKSIYLKVPVYTSCSFRVMFQTTCGRTDGRACGRTNKAATICSPFVEHNTVKK